MQRPNKRIRQEQYSQALTETPPRDVGDDDDDDTDQKRPRSPMFPWISSANSETSSQPGRSRVSSTVKRQPRRVSTSTTAGSASAPATRSARSTSAAAAAFAAAFASPAASHAGLPAGLPAALPTASFAASPSTSLSSEDFPVSAPDVFQERSASAPLIPPSASLSPFVPDLPFHLPVLPRSESFPRISTFHVPDDFPRRASASFPAPSAPSVPPAPSAPSMPSASFPVPSAPSMPSAPPPLVEELDRQVEALRRWPTILEQTAQQITLRQAPLLQRNAQHWNHMFVQQQYQVMEQSRQHMIQFYQQTRQQLMELNGVTQRLTQMAEELIQRRHTVQRSLQALQQEENELRQTEASLEQRRQTVQLQEQKIALAERTAQEYTLASQGGEESQGQWPEVADNFLGGLRLTLDRGLEEPKYPDLAVTDILMFFIQQMQVGRINTDVIATYRDQVVKSKFEALLTLKQLQAAYLAQQDGPELFTPTQKERLRRWQNYIQTLERQYAKEIRLLNYGLSDEAGNYPLIARWVARVNHIVKAEPARLGCIAALYRLYNYYQKLLFIMVLQDLSAVIVHKTEFVRLNPTLANLTRLWNFATPNSNILEEGVARETVGRQWSGYLQDQEHIHRLGFQQQWKELLSNHCVPHDATLDQDFGLQRL